LGDGTFPMGKLTALSVTRTKAAGM